MRLRLGVLGLVVTGLAGCRPSDVLSVPAPAGVQASGSLASQSGAEGAFNGAKGEFFDAADGPWYTGSVLAWGGFLTDELTFSAFAFYGLDANVDARVTTGGGGFSEYGDNAWANLLEARSALLVALSSLARYEPASGRARVGEAYALVGYAELLLAESYCAGTPLDAVVPGGGIHYGMPLTTDSLLGVAIVHFDSALAAANGDATVMGLASVGLGRALVDRGQYAAAATAVQNVTTGFVYNVVLEPTENTTSYTLTSNTANLYGDAVQYDYYRVFTVADREGGNGVNFISARDPRLTFDTTYKTLDGTYGGVVPGTWYLPTKFATNLADIPLATGVEARLIQAEAALKASQVGPWAAALRALRGDSADTHVTFPAADSLPADSAEGASGTAQVDLMFRERAFWLYGTGTRLGDLRRLIRQYGRDQSTVFPTGSYANGHNPGLPVPLPNYGTDVNLTLPTPAGLAAGGSTISNPNYKGCIASTKTA